MTTQPPSSQIVYGQEDDFLPWLCQRIRTPALGHDAKAIGLMRGDKIVAVVGYERFSGNDCSVHIAYDSEHGAIPPAFWTAVYAYPFNQLEQDRVTSLVRSDNVPAIRFCDRQGFAREGLLRRGAGDADLIVFGMLREECKFIQREFVALAQQSEVPVFTGGDSDG